jgi:hypothetical protein
MTTRYEDHVLGPDDHASRPLATAVPNGTLYSCTDHALVYQSDGATWSTYFTSAAGVDHGSLAGLADDDHPQYATNTEFDDHSARHENGGADEIAVTGLSGLLADPQTPLTTWVDGKGDLLVGTAADTAARLAAAANGATVVTASGETTGLKWQLNNPGSASDPTVNDDSGDGYSIGSRWYNTSTDKEFVCLDVSVGAAVWKETTAVGGGGGGGSSSLAMVYIAGVAR